MQTTQLQWTLNSGWSQPAETIDGSPDLILLFGAPAALENPSQPVAALRARYPEALCVGSSSAGEIFGSHVTDGAISAVVIKFATTRVRVAVRPIETSADSYAVGQALAGELTAPDLRHVLVLSDGLKVNGTSLTAGLREGLPPAVAATGGLAGDGADFKRTVIVNGDQIASGLVVALGFYGHTLQVRFGSAGGWESFGPKRLITEAEGNVLYELDGQPALELYKRYLGERAAELPATGLFFPLEILSDTTTNQRGLVRTILAIDEEKQSLTFAGDMPKGHYARLMKASCDRLVFGAEDAALQTQGEPVTLAILVSCVGRKLVMGQRVEEEVEAVLSVLGPGAQVAGFYSYGEICPGHPGHGCELHNQTMTLTTFAEIS